MVICTIMVTKHPGSPEIVPVSALNIPHLWTPLGLKQMGTVGHLIFDFVLSADRTI